ncbi:hypothetical protein HY498_02190 [Candidatus Woesearchaeota archaeon]|nr:hypothetical protein [Candidatus Woesearchaeota archaeon]
MNQRTAHFFIIFKKGLSLDFNMKDIDTDFDFQDESNILEKGIHRKVVLGPNSHAGYVVWWNNSSSSKKGNGHGELSDFLRETERLKRIGPLVEKWIKKYGPKRTYEAVQFLVYEARLTDREDFLFKEFQISLKDKGINYQLLPYIAPEGHV